VKHPPLELRPVLPLPVVAEALRPLLEDPKVRKISARGKLDHILFARAGCRHEGLAFDIPLAAFLLNPARRSVSVEELAQEHLLERPRPAGAILDGGAAEASVDTAAEAGAQEADLVLRLAAPLQARLDEEGVRSAYDEVELPLVRVLAEMERAGVKINPPSWPR
jgi:DNA polymerase-1